MTPLPPTHKLSKPCTLDVGSATEVSGFVPMRVVPYNKSITMFSPEIVVSIGFRSHSEMEQDRVPVNERILSVISYFTEQPDKP
jgi:hypothetical protein